MNLLAHFRLMADYNQWMNRNIYAAAENLDHATLVENRGAFFGSILGTLNHILVGDTIWLKRFGTAPIQYGSLDYVRRLSAPTTLNQILFHDLDSFKSARTTLDDVIIQFVNEIDEDGLLLPLSYGNMKGEPHTKIIGYLLQHFFNHQTHHRGQVSTLFNQIGIDVGVTDLLARIPDCDTV